jgi:hypothetical protein
MYTFTYMDILANPASLSQYQNDPDFLKLEETLEYMHTYTYTHIHTHTHTHTYIHTYIHTEDILANPASLSQYQNDPDFLKLEEKLSQTIPVPNMNQPSTSSDSESEQKKKPDFIRPEDALRGVVALVAELRSAMEEAQGTDKSLRAKRAAQVLERAPKLIADVRCVCMYVCTCE